MKTLIGPQNFYRFFVEGALPLLEIQFIELSYIASTIGAKGWAEATVIPHSDDEWAVRLGVQVLFLRDEHGLIEELQLNGNHQSHSLFLENSRTLSYPINKVMGLFIYFFDSINNLCLKMGLLMCWDFFNCCA